MSRPDGLIECPNGERFWYFDDSHSYWKARYDEKKGEWVRSTRLTGASTLSKPFSYDSGRLLAWKERVTCEGIVTLLNEWEPPEELKYWGDNPPTPSWLYDATRLRAALKDAGHDADSVRDRKADVGTRAHGVLEALAAGESPEAQDGYGQAVINWWLDRKPEVLNCEQFVYSATHGFAGRFDLRARLFSTGEDSLPFTLGLVDLKTSSWLAPSYHVQLELYELAAKECGVGSTDQRIILQVKDDGTYREVPCRATEEDALACIAVYRGAGRIERESGLPRAA